MKESLTLFYLDTQNTALRFDQFPPPEVLTNLPGSWLSLLW